MCAAYIGTNLNEESQYITFVINNLRKISNIDISITIDLVDVIQNTDVFVIVS